MKEDILKKIFGEDERLWKGKYKVEWCDLCDTAIIVCPEENCTATSCNCSSCSKCHEDFKEFQENVWADVDDYLSEDEILAYLKASRLKNLILESIRSGDDTIDWAKFEAQGKLCKNDHKIFPQVTEKLDP